MSTLTKTLRVKAAIVLAVLYALCVLAPAVAFAFSDNPAVAHCLTEGHVGIHDDGAAPQPSHDDGKAAIATCCGLFSVVAIPGEPVPSFGLDSLASVVLPVLGEVLRGRGPERINRPPIV